MNKSARQLTRFQTNPVPLYRAMVLAGLVLYTLPWVVNTGANLSFGAYDLAEWTSLYPAVRFSGDGLLWEVFLLRIPPTLLVLILTVNDTSERFSQGWWVLLGIVTIISVALLPPFEFLANMGDANYRQQFMIAVLTLISGAGMVIFSTRLTPSMRGVITFGLMLGLVGSALGGWFSAAYFMHALHLPAYPGAGFIGLVALGVMTIIVMATSALTLPDSK